MLCLYKMFYCGPRGRWIEQGNTWFYGGLSGGKRGFMVGCVGRALGTLGIPRFLLGALEDVDFFCHIAIASLYSKRQYPYSKTLPHDIVICKQTSLAYIIRVYGLYSKRQFTLK